MRAIVLALLVASCTDPVRDRQIEALGDEASGVDPGPDHRPGQPCVLCHSAGGPASKQPFVVAGTLYATSAPGSPGAGGYELRFVDGNNGSPTPGVVVLSSASGNFFVREDDWKDMVFPFKVAIFKDGKYVTKMTSPVSREPSCNACHMPAPIPPLRPEDADRERKSIGPVTVGGAR